MILNFQFKNWACYRDEVCLSMQAGPERDIVGHLPRFGSPSRPEKVLPIAAVYGGNASGKTQLVKAIRFLQQFVLGVFPKGVLPHTPFLLDEKDIDTPTEFTIQFLSGDTVYEYGVIMGRTKILSEELSYFSARGAKKVPLFVRKDRVEVLSIKWGTPAFQAYARELTISDTQPFLSLSYDLCSDSEHVKTVYGWFADRLFVISPDMHYLGVEDFCSEGRLLDVTLDYLKRFDTGINSFEPRRVDPSSLPPIVLEDLSNKVRAGTNVRAQVGNGDILMVTRLETGALEVRKLFAAHKTAGNGVVPFSMDRESDGTRRMLDLIPAFARLRAQDSNAVYVIDEIDRSLHYLVSRAFISEYLESCRHDSRSQLIFTTHDLLLMDQGLLRRDEMYIVDKSPDGVSSLVDLRQFKGLRKDTDVRARYLEGRFGGIVRNLRLVQSLHVGK